MVLSEAHRPFFGVEAVVSFLARCVLYKEIVALPFPTVIDISWCLFTVVAQTLKFTSVSVKWLKGLQLTAVELNEFTVVLYNQKTVEGRCCIAVKCFGYRVAMEMQPHHRAVYLVLFSFDPGSTQGAGSVRVNIFASVCFRMCFQL